MSRLVDTGLGALWEIWVHYECNQCRVHIMECNYSWVFFQYGLIEQCCLEINRKDPSVGAIYGSYANEDIDYNILNLKLNSIYLSSTDIEKINKKLQHFLLLT